MKNLIFESLELLSLTEKTARRVEFHPRLTVITGKNRVGKSSLIKSIYWTLGAEPAVVHPRWKGVNVKSLLTFTVDGARYQALRNKNTVAIFDAQGELLLATSAFTSELGPFMATLLDFGLVLSNRKGEPETPPPAYAFLPFYVDQDGGWQSPLTSFANLGQYTRFRPSLVYFHSGIRPNEYYALTAMKKRLEIEKAAFEQDRTIVVKARDKLKLQPEFSGLELSVEEHEKAINDLLVRLRSLFGSRQVRAVELADILDQRASLDQQISMVQASANELADDAAWAAEQGDEIMCPTCGVVHANDFRNRFAILGDREECFEFLNEAQQKRRQLADKVTKLQITIRETDATIGEMQRILEEKRGALTLEDVIEARGRAAAYGVFEEQISELDNEIGGKAGEISDTEDEIAKLEDPARRDLIENYYASLMGAYMRNLNIKEADNDAVMKIAGKIVETGSEQPRLLLAYVLALADTIQKYTTAFTAPLVIDSPVQQEQDMSNAPAIIRQVISKRPNGGQTIVGTISLYDNEPEDAEIIIFTDDRSVLRSSEYDAVHRKMTPLLSSM
ncbi:MAG: hypothetical protein AAGD15_08340 [Agrobacterium cavarae]|uniref:hypothetical protein n=1 Tax=Agrobacterium cavarae TaxID=2528239 RepID=UPI0031A208EB